MKNVPNKFSQKEWLDIIDIYQFGVYNFFYLPFDKKNRNNLGYAFFNLWSPEYILKFYSIFHNKKWEFTD